MSQPPSDTFRVSQGRKFGICRWNFDVVCNSSGDIINVFAFGGHVAISGCRSLSQSCADSFPAVYGRKPQTRSWNFDDIYHTYRGISISGLDGHIDISGCRWWSKSQSLKSPWSILPILQLGNNIYVLCFVFTARCTIMQSAVSRLHDVHPSVRLSVCNVGGSGPHRLEILETNYTDN